MLQKNHHFLFPQTYFESFQSFEDDLFCEEEDEEGEALIETSHVPWVLVLDQEKINPLESKIGLFIHWTDHLG